MRLLLMLIARHHNRESVMDLKYPRPDRSDFRPNFEKTLENDVLDIGWAEGILSDGIGSSGRRQHLRSWRSDALSVPQVDRTTLAMTTIIGIDCSAVRGRPGLALTRGAAGRLEVLETTLDSRTRSPADVVSQWLLSTSAAILAFDAPLGWPR